MKNFWGGRFSKSADKNLQEYWNSIAFDKELAVYDIAGSLAHAEMLGKCGIINKEEQDRLTSGLKELLKEAEEDKLDFSLEDEDIHMNIERLLQEKIGPLAGKLHTARSRNDQVALDIHLYVRDKALRLFSYLLDLSQILITQAVSNKDVIMCGYTHLQRAQPVLFAHHLLAYVSMFERDMERIQCSFPRINTSPLGAGAVAGTTFPIDRKYTAELLKFEGLYQNSMDAVSDRDFLVEFMSNCAIISMHLSRFCEEVVIWTSYEFNFITLDDSYSTGSSMMPQKKNPDLAELIRGKTGRVYGNLFAILTTLKGLPLTYNKDMQEDKECLFDTVKTLEGALFHLKGMIETWQVNDARMREAAESNFTDATDFADYLSKKGIPFREAHEITGRLVRDSIEKEKEITRHSLQELKKYSHLIEDDIFEELKLENIVSKRNSFGGTSPASVSFQTKTAQDKLKQNTTWLKSKISLLEQIKI